MPFLSHSEAFKGYTHGIIIGVYTDKITATAVRKENNGSSVAARAVEPVESTDAAHPMLSPEKAVFNAEKAIMALPHDMRTPATPIIVALGPGTGEIAYGTVKGKREARERKITSEEIEMVIAGGAEAGNTIIERKYPEYFSVDGFFIPDPVGVNGEEMAIGAVRTSCDAAFEHACAMRMTALGFRLAGMIDMRYAAMHARELFRDGGSALCVMVFEHAITIAVVRDNSVRAVGAARVGYGILYADIAAAFSVGYEEAKAIVRAYRKGELDDTTKATVETTIMAAMQTMVTAARETIARVDPENIIPGTVRVVCADGIPEVSARFMVDDWLSDLPIERHTAITVVREEDAQGFSTAFDRMVSAFLIGHH